MPDLTYTLFKEGRMRQKLTGSMINTILPTLENWDGEYVEGEYDDTWWLRSGNPVKRQPCPAVADGLFLRGVPAGSTIIIEGESYACDAGGDISLTFEYPGTYNVRVIRWPYLDGEYIIENSP